MIFASRKVLWTMGLFSVVFPLVAAAQENTIYKELMDKGVPLANGKTVKLPQPVMVDGLSAADQLAVIAKLVAPAQLNDFLAGRVSSPFTLIMKDNDILGAKPTDSIGRRIDLYYVANGKLSTVSSEGFVKQQLDQGKNEKRGAAQYYTDDELKARNLTVINTDKVKERYAHADIPLFGQVKVMGTGRGMRTSTPDSVLVDFVLDPRFVDDKQYPNQWQSGHQDKLGNTVYDPPKPYSGAGAYMKVTKLQEPPGLQNAPERVFIEYHLVFDEPNGWFGGGNNLIAKLPNRFEADVRKFREDLKKYEERMAGGKGALLLPPANPSAQGVQTAANQ